MTATRIVLAALLGGIGVLCGAIVIMVEIGHQKRWAPVQFAQ